MLLLYPFSNLIFTTTQKETLGKPKLIELSSLPKVISLPPGVYSYFYSTSLSSLYYSEESAFFFKVQLIHFSWNPIPSCLPEVFFHVIILLPSTKSFLSAYKLNVESPVKLLAPTSHSNLYPFLISLHTVHLKRLPFTLLFLQFCPEHSWASNCQIHGLFSSLTLSSVWHSWLFSPSWNIFFTSFFPSHWTSVPLIKHVLPTKLYE